MKGLLVNDAPRTRGCPSWDRLDNGPCRRTRVRSHSHRRNRASRNARRDRDRDRQTIQEKQLREDAAKPLGDAMGVLSAAQYYMGLRGDDVNLFDLRAIAETRGVEADETRPLLRHLAGLWPEAAEEINTVESYLGQLPNHLRLLGDFSRIEPDAFDDEESRSRILGMIESFEEDYQEAINALDRLYGRLPARRTEGLEQ